MQTRTAAVIGLGAMAVLVSAGWLVWCVDAASPTTRVTEQYSGFDTGRFQVLLFPTAENAVCGRAVLARLDEYERDTIDFYKDGVVVAVGKERFTAAPPGEYPTLIEHLNAELAVWGEETDWQHIAWDFELGAQGITATLSVKDKRGTLWQYEYLIADGSVEPVSAKTVVDIAKKMGD